MSSNAAPDDNKLVRHLATVQLGVIDELHRMLVDALKSAVSVPTKEVVAAVAFLLGTVVAGALALGLSLLAVVASAPMAFLFLFLPLSVASALYFPTRVKLSAEQRQLELAWTLFVRRRRAIDETADRMRRDGCSPQQIEQDLRPQRLQALEGYLSVLSELQRSNPTVQEIVQSVPAREMLGPGRDAQAEPPARLAQGD